jgi:CubicO group peptidase (beta-lactamase class C family)
MSHTNPMLTQAPLTRRTFLTLSAATAAGIALRSCAFAKTDTGVLPATGDANPNLEPFDRLMTSFIEENKVPGASLAVTRHGKLVYARGFGYSDVEKQEGVKPDALFRIASVSKPFTAVAIMQLVEKGKLSLDDKVMDRMKLEPFVLPGAKPDPRWRQITVRQCLQHTGGWDRDVSYDPIARPWDIAQALGIRPPVAPVQIVRYMMGQPLDFDPGERHVYSNLGYLVLGRISEVVTGQKYEAYVKKEVFEPLGIKAPRLGRALLENRAKGEVRYYDSHERTAPALYPPQIGKTVPLQYGGENFEAFEAHGGWIASAVDLVRFASAFDTRDKCKILGAKSIEQMWARPSGAAGTEPDGTPKAAYYGCGWMVRPIRGMTGLNTWHAGNIAGSESLLVRRWDGLNWAVLFNTAKTLNGNSLAGLIDSPIHWAADKVKKWPNIDQFEKFSIEQ